MTIYEAIESVCSFTSPSREDDNNTSPTRSLPRTARSYDSSSNASSRNTGPSEILRSLRHAGSEDEASSRLEERRFRERMGRPSYDNAPVTQRKSPQSREFQQPRQKQYHEDPKDNDPFVGFPAFSAADVPQYNQEQESAPSPPSRMDVESPKGIDEDEDDNEDQKGRRKYKTCLFLLLIVILLAVIGVGAYFIVRAVTDDDSNTIPTNEPTGAPTGEPTPSPTSHAPSTAPSAVPTTSLSPTLSLMPSVHPSATPTIDVEAAFRSFLGDYGVSFDSEEANLSLDWMIDEARLGNVNELYLTHRVTQRFALLSMDYALTANTDEGRRNLSGVSRRLVNKDQCEWPGIVCDIDGEVTELRWGDVGFRGSIPSQVKLLTNLNFLDLSKNELKGTIPEEIYGMINLKNIYLYRNKLSGSISSLIGELTNLVEFNVAVNQLEGPLPTTFKTGPASTNLLPPLRVFNVYNNQLTGTIPDNMRLRRMFYYDLGKNKLTGTIPEQLGNEYVRLRHLNLDGNQLTGTIPYSTVNAAGGNLISLSLENNQLTGALPENEILTKMVQYLVYHNNLSSMSSKSCGLSVYRGGELTEFKSDCDICPCGNNNILCIWCVK